MLIDIRRNGGMVRLEVHYSFIMHDYELTHGVDQNGRLMEKEELAALSDEHGPEIRRKINGLIMETN